MKSCLNCNLEVGESLGSKPKIFCCSRCKSTYGARERRKAIAPKHTYLSECLECGVSIKAPRRKFCCQKHKNKYNLKHLYGDKYSNKCRSSSPEKFIKTLMGYYKRRETLTDEYVFSIYHKQGGLCALSGRQMTFICGQGYQVTNISIDRIDSSIGYVEGNIQLVCRAVNVMKSVFTQDDFVNFCYDVVNSNPRNNKASNLKVMPKSKNRGKTKNGKRV